MSGAPTSAWCMSPKSCARSTVPMSSSWAAPAWRDTASCCRTRSACQSSSRRRRRSRWQSAACAWAGRPRKATGPGPRARPRRLLHSLELDRADHAVRADADLVTALPGDRVAALVGDRLDGAVIHAHRDFVFRMLARLALDLVARHRTDHRADRRARAVVTDLVADHRAADAAGDRAEARALAEHFGLFHVDDNAAIHAGGRDLLAVLDRLRGAMDLRGMRSGCLGLWRLGFRFRCHLGL